VHKEKSEQPQEDLEEPQEDPDWGICPVCLDQLRWPLKHIREVHQLDSTLFSSTVRGETGGQTKEEKDAVRKARNGYMRKVIFKTLLYKLSTEL
jgi:hypothetical protein